MCTVFRTIPDDRVPLKFVQFFCHEIFGVSFEAFFTNLKLFVKKRKEKFKGKAFLRLLPPPCINF